MVYSMLDLSESGDPACHEYCYVEQAWVSSILFVNSNAPQYVTIGCQASYVFTALGEHFLWHLFIIGILTPLV